MMRSKALRFLLILVFFSLVAGTSLAGQEKDPTGEGFMTNLAFLDQITREAVDAVLDSLAFAPGQGVTIVAGGSSEANQFIADAFAKALARKGYEVHLAMESSAPPTPAPAAASPGETSPPGSQPPAGESAGGGAPPLGSEQDTSSTGGATGSAIPASVSSPDSSGLGDSTSVPAAGATPSTNGGPRTRPEAPSPSGAAKENTTPSSGPIPAPKGKLYPEGSVLEFRVLEFGVHYPTVKRRFAFFGNASVHRLGGVYIEASRVEGPDGRVIDVASGQCHSQDRLSGHARALAEGANYPFTKPVIPASNVSRMVEPVLVVGIVSSLVYLFYQNQK
jgi:hypothetical protein